VSFSCSVGLMDPGRRRHHNLRPGFMGVEMGCASLCLNWVVILLINVVWERLSCQPCWSYLYMKYGILPISSVWKSGFKTGKTHDDNLETEVRPS
jgi:hypothetical protein